MELKHSLQKLVEAAEKVLEPVLTGSDGGVMWCTMRGQPGAKEHLECFKEALKSAKDTLAATPKVIRTKEFDTLPEAEAYCEKYNSKNKEETVPDYYTYA